MNHSTRWREARLTLRLTLCDALTVVRSRVPVLTVLSLRCLEPIQMLVDAFEMAPCLMDITLMGMGKDAKIPIPGSQLVHFSDDRVYSDFAATRHFLSIISKS